MRYCFSLFIAATLFIACGNKREKSAQEAPKGPVSSHLSALGTQQLTDVIDSYYELKNALVADDAARTILAAKNLLFTTDSLQRIISVDSTYKNSLLPVVDTIKAQSIAIASIKDETCEKQRIPFGTLSGAMYSLAQQSGLTNSLIYRQYCPMAFNNTGAYWLSNDEEIKNPYFGAKMLECGEITDTIK
jgi:Cu(I)/Ag(I) efflux system membrane fusion protein